MAISKIPSAGFQDNVKFRNIIINGDMSIAQRGTSATGLGNGDSGYHTVDRFKFVESGSPSCEFTQSQSTDVPTGQGFANSLKMDCTTADASLGADDFVYINTSVEGQNLQYIKKGTSSAESLTLSFWVKSNKTGTYIFEIIDRDNNRAISKSYTISSSDTWEKKTITYTGDTTGTLDNDNARSFELIYWLGAGANFSSGTLQTSWNTRTTTNDAVGQVNLADSTSNEWLITGVQVESGTASDFEFLPHDVNLQRCQRYYFVKASGSSQDLGIATYYTSSDLRGSFGFPTTMRATPTLEVTVVTDAYDFRRNSGVDRMSNFVLNNASLTSVGIINNSAVSGNAGQSGHLFTDGANCFVAVSSEL